jgi:hypothetical protein
VPAAFSLATPDSRGLSNISTPATTILRGAFLRPTISTSSPTSTMPRMVGVADARSLSFEQPVSRRGVNTSH